MNTFWKFSQETAPSLSGLETSRGIVLIGNKWFASCAEQKNGDNNFNARNKDRAFKEQQHLKEIPKDISKEIPMIMERIQAKTNNMEIVLIGLGKSTFVRRVVPDKKKKVN